MHADNSELIKKALLEIRSLKDKLRAFEEKSDSDIAIIGMACRLPGGINSLESYWEFLTDQKDGIEDIPLSRLNREKYPHKGGFIHDIEHFDPIFFGISPREAALIDPQHRILLEVCWEALEHACIRTERENDPFDTGVFVGITTNDYLTNLLENLNYREINSFFGTGNAHNAASGRISHTYGFKGPSMSIDTACSSSLTSIHLACQALLANDCKMALAGGVNALLNPVNSVITERSKMISPDNRCKTFDNSANGYIRSEGCGIVVLKKYTDAVKDGDRILAVIKSSGVNHNAVSNSFTVPNMNAQASLIKNVLQKSNIMPSAVSYIEAHGTGTNLGDPIELRALETVFADSHSADHPLYIGAAKSNIGHTESAAGVAGLIKAVLCLQYQSIPGNLHFNEPNKNIDWKNLPFKIPTAPVIWKSGAEKRYAGISSFGVSGTNAHILIGEADEQKIPFITAQPHYLLTLSAKTPAALQSLKNKYYNQFFKDDVNLNIRDICLTSNKCRSHFKYRFAKEISHVKDLEKFLSGKLAIDDSTDPIQKLTFLFSGQEADFYTIAHDLYQFVPCFQTEIDWCELFLKEKYGYSIIELFSAGSFTPEKYHHSQLILFCFEYALAKMWMSLGIKPDACLGYGTGEYAAACIARVFTFDEGIRILQARLVFEERKVLSASIADEEFKAVLQTVDFRKPIVPLISNVTGDSVSDQLIEIDYWRSRDLNFIGFNAGLQDVLNNGESLLEIGVNNLSAETLQQLLNKNIRVFSSFSEKSDGSGQIYQTLALFYEKGFPINWAALNDEPFSKTDLPTYSFQKDYIWHAIIPNKWPDSIHPFYTASLNYAGNTAIHIFKGSIDKRHQFIKDHCIHEKITVPATVYIEMMLATIKVLDKENPGLIGLKNVSFNDIVLFDETVALELQSVCELTENKLNISIYQADHGHSLCSSGSLSTVDHLEIEDLKPHPDSQGTEVYNEDEFYALLRERGYQYGTAFRGVKDIKIYNDIIVGSIGIPAGLLADYSDYFLHPAILDACFQLAAARLIYLDSSKVYVPAFMSKLILTGNSYKSLVCYAKINSGKDDSSFAVTYHLYNEDDQPVSVIENVIFRQLISGGQTDLTKKCYHSEWDIIEPEEFTVSKQIKKAILFNFNHETHSPLEGVPDYEHALCLEVNPSGSFYHDRDNRYFINTESEGDYQLLFNEVGNVDQLIINLTASDDNQTHQLEADHSLNLNIYAVLTLLKVVLKKYAGNSIPELVILSPIENNFFHKEHTGFANADIWSLITTINQEEPRLKCKILGIERDKIDKKVLNHVLSNSTNEERIIIKDGNIFVSRLKPLPKIDSTLKDDYKLKIDETGSFDNLKIQAITPEYPKDNEVGISIVASGLNFKEVLYTLGTLPVPGGDTSSYEFGFECAGIVKAVGSQVQGIKVGDEVIAALASGSIGSYTNVRKEFIYLKPAQLSFEEAASLPVVFITAYHALVNLANINEKSKVLIHAAAGGVGLAAGQIARLKGSVVYATASIQKHALLESLGINHIYNSRNLDFEAQILQETNGEGVDVVLNSFSEEYIFKSLNLLKQGGYFLEIGKVNQHIIDKIRMLRPDVIYSNFDIGEIALEDPEMIHSIFKNVLQMIEDEQLKPIAYQSFGIQEAAKAFGVFARGENVGKIVLTHYQRPELSLFYPQDYYLITGGTGGLGLSLAHWLYEQGARNIILLSRKGIPESNPFYEELIGKGLNIECVSVDISDSKAVEELFSELKRDKKNLRGIFHTAGILDDHLISHQDSKQVARVLAPKTIGTWNLHLYSQNFNLNYFVCFSSIASLIGSVGQSAYAAANGTMDAIMSYRKSLYLQGTSLNWGPFGEVGMAKDLKMQLNGINKLKVKNDFHTIDSILRRNLNQVCIVDIDWKTLGENSGYYSKNPLLSSFQLAVKSEPQQDQEVADGPVVANEDIYSLIGKTIKSVLDLPENYRLDVHKSLFDYGLDSLLAVEIKNKIEKITKLELPPTLLFNFPTLNEITNYIIESKASEIEDDQLKEQKDDPENFEALLSVDDLTRLINDELRNL